MFSLLTSCASWEQIKEGTYNNKKYSIDVKEIKGFSTNRLIYRIKVPNLKTIELSYKNTDNGIPYDYEMYKGTKHKIFNYITNQEAELLKIFNTSHYSMLYLDCSDKDFDAYEQFFTSEWATISSVFTNKGNNRYKPTLLGIVANNKNDFIKTYQGTLHNAPHTLEIFPDGTVEIDTKDKNAKFELPIFYGIEMPGKIILVNHLSKVTKADFENFVDKNGNKLLTDFDIKLVDVNEEEYKLRQSFIDEGIKLYQEKKLPEALELFSNLSQQAIPDERQITIISWYNAKLLCETNACQDAAILWSNAIEFSKFDAALHEQIKRDYELYHKK